MMHMLHVHYVYTKNALNKGETPNSAFVTVYGKRGNFAFLVDYSIYVSN